MKRAAISAVSIHAPYIGSDGRPAQGRQHHQVSIHAPYIGSDVRFGHRGRRCGSFNPRSLHRERPEYSFDAANRMVSIHAPYIGSDLEDRIKEAYNAFQSTLPT